MRVRANRIGNTLTINATIGTTIAVYNIFGGWSRSGNATGNTVNITGGTFDNTYIFRWRFTHWE